MTLLFSKHTRGAERAPSPQWAGEVVSKRFTYALTAAQNVSANIVDLGILPANMRFVDAILDVPDLDAHATPTLVLDIGLMSGSPGEALDSAGNARTCGDELFDGVTTGQAGGVLRTSEMDAFSVAPVAYDRSIGVKIVTGPATTTSGTIGLTVLMASS